jgi:N-acetylmuramoyl-L-alanine amidase
MSDSPSWIDNADNERIREIVTRSADVIVAARQDLEEYGCCVDSRRSTELPKREFVFQPADQQLMTSAQRRAFFRQLLRTPTPDLAIRPPRKGRNLLAAEHFKERVGATSSSEIPKSISSEIPKRRSARTEAKRLRGHFEYQDNEEPPKRDEQINRRRKRRDEETSDRRSLVSHFSSMLASGTQRVDNLTNVVLGVLATVLVIFLFFRAGPSDPFAGASSRVANAKNSGDHQAVLMASGGSLYRGQGFNILLKAFPEALPTFAEDISGLMFLASSSPASAPGITVLTYIGLPRSLPAFPKDIGQLIMFASSPGPDGRDYLIRTLVFEASGETKIGKFAVAHAILNRQRTGRWGRKIADVVTSPLQFEPWGTRKSEIEGLSRTDPRYREAAKIVDAVLAGYVPDPTAGATHFLNPVIVQERRGGSLPSWAESDGQPIGRHVFYCPECNGTKPTRTAVVKAGEVKRSKPTPAASDPVRPPSIGRTVVAEAPAEVRAAKAAPAVIKPVAPKAAPAVIKPVAQKLEARPRPTLTTQRQQTQLPWLNPTKAGQGRNFVPHSFW